jgi:asparagine synthase (glutamine-hydrolysing)
MLKSYIERAVVERWISSDRPVGLLVSGGLDSSIIYYVLRNWLGFDTIKRIPIFHIENNESEYLAYLDHNPEKIYRLKYGTGIDVLYYAESPMDRGSLLPQYLLSKAIGRIGIRVVLSGDGADELFCGYRRCQEKDTRNFDLRELRIWHLPRLDKMMMANTIELRCPFLADNIIGHITRYTWREIANKVPLKEIAKDIGVPDEIINREKKPLKSPESASNKISWQNFLVSEFIKHYPTGLHNEH